MFSTKHYERVSLTADSSDEDEVTLFDAAASQFGAGSSYDRERALDLPRVHVTRRKYDRGARPAVRAACLFAAVLAVVLALAAAVAFFSQGRGRAPGAPPPSSSSALPSPSPPNAAAGTPSHPHSPPPTSHPGATTSDSEAQPTQPEAPPTTPPGSISWERDFFPASTEATLQLADMNGDGVSDVVALDGFSMCAGRVVALDGRSGRTVWHRTVQFPAFAIRCELDLNGDGRTDCLAAGRVSGFVALSGADGLTLWARDPSVTFFRYNYYFPLTLGDLDGDGVADLANMHGGDSTYTDDDRQRSPSRLVVLSGRTGGKLMEPLPTPDGGESYMSPVLFSFADGEEVVLFGSGGETLPGSLWAISLDSLRARVAAYKLTRDYAEYKPLTEYKNHACLGDLSDKRIETGRPTFDPTAYAWSRNASGSSKRPPSHCRPLAGQAPIRNKFGVCVWEVLRAEREGVILPPVLVDLTGDGHDDVVVTTFDGVMLVLDGRDGSTVWTRRRPGTESYSIPAPLFFNGDATLDLLVRDNFGVYRDGYSKSRMAILDGRHGNTIWSLNSSSTGMMSGLSVASIAHGNDAALFFTLGKELGVSSVAEGEEVEGEGLKGEGVKVEEVGASHQRRRSDSTEECRHGVYEPSCPAGDWGRGTRHAAGAGGGDLGDIGRPDTDSDDDNNGRMDYSFDPIQGSLNTTDSPELWTPSEGETFPDPHTDFSAFLRYCGHRMEELSGSLYFVTMAMAQSHAVRPLMTHPPLFHDIPSHPHPSHPHSSRRHGHDDSSHHRLTPKEERCSHIQAPLLIPPSPVLGDLNGDGRLEVVYAVIYSPLPGAIHSPSLRIKAFTIEDRFREQFPLISFPPLRPPDQQPWWRYMGAHGNGRFTRMDL